MKSTAESDAQEEPNELMRAVEGCLKSLKQIAPPQTSSTPSHLYSLEDVLSQSAGQVPTGHVMLSYNWGSKEVVRSLKTQLKAEGFNTWIDEENMPPGSVIDGMEAAITNAAMMLVCFSEGYKKSPPCRMEAEYALKKGKPMLYVKAEKNYRPDGWLEFIMGQKLYYDVGKPQVTQQLVKHIRDIYAGVTAEPLPVAPLTVSSASAMGAEGHSSKLGASATPSTKTGKPPAWSKWTEVQVLKWLKDNKLDVLSNPYFLRAFRLYKSI